MRPAAATNPELALILERLSVFLDGAEEALSQARPEDVVQVGGTWAALCRDLRRVEAGQWPSADHRLATLGRLVTRTAALQQAIVRAQARLERELQCLREAADEPRTADDSVRRSPVLPVTTYDSAGVRRPGLLTNGTYA